MDTTDWPRVSEILDTKDWGIKKAPKFILRKYGAYGTSFHNLVHKKVTGKRCRVTQRFKDKWEVFREYLKQYEILRSEEQVYWISDKDPSRRYKGTPDLLVRKIADNTTWILDVKTGKFYERHWYQQSAYKLALEQRMGIKIDGMILVRPQVDCVEEEDCENRETEFLELLDKYNA